MLVYMYIDQVSNSISPSEYLHLTRGLEKSLGNTHL